MVFCLTLKQDSSVSYLHDIVGNVLWLYDSYTTYLKSNIVFTMQ